MMYVLIVAFGLFSFVSIGIQFLKDEKERREKILKNYKIKIMYEAYYDNAHNIAEYNNFIMKVQSTENVDELYDLYDKYFVA